MTVDRRRFLAGSAALVATGAVTGAATGLVAPKSGHARTPTVAIQSRPIPSSGEAMPIVGLGTWITFNVGSDPKLLDRSADVMRAFFDGGGQMIDTSPMYGSAQETVGYGLKRIAKPERVFSAEKVWTSDGDNGAAQIAASRGKWGVPQFDLVQVHNMVAWRAHLKTLRGMKERGAVRYIGVSTSHGRGHGRLERIMKREPLDFIQVTYNVADRAVEQRILPLAREKGIGVIINRPYQRGALIRRFSGKPLPGLANEIGAKSWAQFLLKFVLSHPAVTCAIPATTQVDHVRENLACATGPLPDAAMRRRMLEAIASA